LIYIDKFQIQFLGLLKKVSADNMLYRNFTKIESDNKKLNESVIEGENKQEPENLSFAFDKEHNQQLIKLPYSVKPVDEDDKNRNEIEDDNKRFQISIGLQRPNLEVEINHRRKYLTVPTTVPTKVQTTVLTTVQTTVPTTVTTPVSTAATTTSTGSSAVGYSM
jgi:hypothetical protein